MEEAQIHAFGNYAHDVRGILQYDFKLKEKRAYELIGRYPTMLLWVFTQGKSAKEAANLIMIRH